MQGIQLEQQAVAEHQLATGGRTASRQLEYGVSAVGMRIHQVVGKPQLAGTATRQCQPPEGP